MFVTLFLVAFGAGIASADGETQDLGLPSSEDLIQQIEAADSASVDLPSTDAQAAESLPHHDLDRDEAAALLEGVFGDQLQAPAGIFDELNVVKFLGPNVALLEKDGSVTPAPDEEEEPSGEIEVEPSSEEGSPALVKGDGQLSRATLLESSIPLRTEPSVAAAAAVDLSLHRENGELQPGNPLVEVEIPQTLGEGIALPGAGVTIELSGGPDSRSSSVIDGNVGFLPNVALDTDLAVAPTPTGVETLTQLRSAESPHTQTFNLNLPTGAVLKATESGGAAVLEGKEPLLVVMPPTAIDATGASVPVDMTVHGNSLTLAVSIDKSTSFPILVDPLYQSYNWVTGNPLQSGICNSSFTSETFSSCNDHEEWSFEHTEKQFPPHIHIENRTYSPNSPVPYGTAGIFIETHENLTTGDKGKVNYTVPRYFSDYKVLGERPTSYIAQMRLWNLDWNAWSSHFSPYLIAGIWDEVKGTSPAYYSHEGLEGHGLTDMSWEYKFPATVSTNTNVKSGYVSTQATETQPNQNTELYVGFASIQLGDVGIPGFGPVYGPSQWVNQTALPISFTVSDSGLGVQSLTLSDQGSTPHSWKTSYGCIGVADAACPRSWKSTDSGPPVPKYEPAILPQGINNLNVVVEDPVGNKSATAIAQVKVDHTAPTLTLAGSLADHASLGTLSADYTLKYLGMDGDSQAATAIAPFGSAGTGLGQMQRPMGVALDASGNVWVLDCENNRVIKFDETGKFLSQFGTLGSANGQFNDPRGIAVSPNGIVWVSEFGNKRVQAFNLKGEFIRKITSTGTEGGGSFVQPNGLAIGPGGVLWVSDTATHGLYEFSEGGSFIRKAYGSASSPTGASDLSSPTGLATDTKGNVWVTDNANNRLQKFDSNGKFVTQFGSTGTGNGQFNGAVGVAVAKSGNLLVTDDLNNRVQEFQHNGVYLRQFGSVGASGGQLKEPRGIAINGEGTAFVVDAGNRRVAKWSHADLDPQSGVVGTEVKVDGQLAEPKYAPGCTSKDCTISREWTLHASDYSSGQHKVEVTATDAVGLSTTKELTITTDNTPPQLKTISSYFLTPKGWLEQKTYSYSTSFSDIGYGVTSLVYKIDGKVVNSVQQTCPGGACSIALAGSIDMTAYSGGAHTAELTATDGAGNKKTFTKTLNVDPQGQVSTAEAVDTLEAVGETTESDLVAPTEELISTEERADGNDPSLVKDGDLLESKGVPNPSAVSTDPKGGFTVVTSDTTINAQPVTVGGASTSMSITEGSAAVAGNTTGNVDTVIRPIFDGVLTFSSIRDKSASEYFSWEVQLPEGQSLKQSDPMDAEIVYEDGTRAVLISAEEAHDAAGTSVPTSLSVTEGNILTLVVAHKDASYVYPVVAGAGWEGGYSTEIVAGPKDEQEVKVEQERIWQEEHEAMERAAEQETTSGDEPPGEGVESKNSANIRRVMVNVGAPEMYDWVHRKRRSKAYAGYCNSILSQLKCDDWHTWEVGTWFWNGTYHHVGGYAWRGDTIAKCYSTESTLFENDLGTMGWSGPDPAPYGYGKYLNLWCNFNVSWYNLTAHETHYYQVQDHLYGDGYQGQHLKDMPPPVLEN